MLIGNKPETNENYQKTIEINPRNKNGDKMLEELELDANYPTKQYFNFLESDSSWRKETFHPPIHFAQDIDH